MSIKTFNGVNNTLLILSQVFKVHFCKPYFRLRFKLQILLESVRIDKSNGYKDWNLCQEMSLYMRTLSASSGTKFVKRQHDRDGIC